MSELLLKSDAIVVQTGNLKDNKRNNNVFSAFSTLKSFIIKMPILP